MYKLLFIDEEKEQWEQFLNYIEDTNNESKFDILTEYPKGNIEDMIDSIFKINPDVLVTDFWLNEKIGELGYNVPYNGVELVEEFHSIRPKFPCFVLTAKDSDAINASEDVNIVYTKSLMKSEVDDTKAKITFADRIVSQITHYKERIKKWEVEYDKLLELRKNGKASMFDEQRIIELDSLLEKSIDSRTALPNEFKSLTNIEKLDELISGVDDLLDKIDSENEK